MKIVLLAVGKIRSAPLRELCLDYLKRLQRYGPAEVTEIKSADPQSGPAGIAAAVAQESARLLSELLAGDAVFILDERGVSVSSVELSALFKKQELAASKRLVFILGGAYGMGADVKARGKLLSLSKLTFPHELCRAFILEQLYRARTIQRGEPYHHA